MSSRGILQLQRLKVSFCDWSGSSNGIRNFFKSDKFYNHVNGNPSIAFEFHLRRGRHPFITAVYANGWEKDISLRNMSEEDVFGLMKHVKSNIGRVSLPHNGHKVTSYNKSIQGPWESNMWNSYPRHGILEFMKMKEHRYTWEMFGAEKPWVKKKLPQTYTRIAPSNRQTFNEL